MRSGEVSGRRWSVAERAPATLAAVGAAALALACGGDGGTGAGPSTRTVSMDLAVGESRTAETGGDVLVLEFPSADGAREYRLAVWSTSRTAGSLVGVRLDAGASDGSGAVGWSGPGLAARGPRAFPPPGLGVEELAREWELRLREAARRELRRRNAVPARGGATPAGVRLSLHPSEVPQAGDSLRFLYPIQDDFSISCDPDDADTITAVVRGVSGEIAMVEDVETPAAISDAEYQSLADEFDDVVFAADTAYFGPPSDIDGNERVIVLLTPEVNKLSDPGGSTFVAGFFLPTDLAESGDGGGNANDKSGNCPSSNEAELLYLLAPDPNGDFGPVVDAERAKENARSVSSHEFEHLLSAVQRLIFGSGGFATLEDVWLGEALAHLAEEIVGLKKIGAALRANLAFGDVASTQDEIDAFNTFQIQNFARTRQYMLDPEGTLTLGDVNERDPGGIESLKMRGFAYTFARWLGDQYGPSGDGTLPGSREQELFRFLSRGGESHLTGVDNVEAALSEVAGVSRTWRELLPDHFPSLSVDDQGVSGLPEAHQFLTWDYRDVFLGLHENEGSGQTFTEEYPLSVSASGFGSTTVDFELRSSAAKHFSFSGSGPVPPFSITLTDQTGGALAEKVRVGVTVVRVR